MENTVKEWFIHQALEHSRRTILVAILATLIVGAGIRFFVVDDDFLKMLPKDIESRLTWDAVREEFGNTNVIFIAFGNRGEDVLNPRTLATLWDLSQALEAIPEIDEVISIATLNRMDSDEGFLEVSDLQPERELSPEAIDAIRAFLEKTPDMKVRVVGHAGDYMNVVVRPHVDVGNDVIRNKVVETADVILEGYDVHYGGQAYITGTIPMLIRNDVVSLMRTGLIIMVIILLANLRSVPAVGMVLGVIVLSLIAMLGFMGWVYHFTGSDKFLFTMLNTSMPIIMLTIANSDGVHIMTKFFREVRKRQHVVEAIRETMHSLLLPVFLTSLTTVAAFLAMIFAPLEQMVGFGISISFGIIWAWLLSSAFLPALISLKRWNLESKAFQHSSMFEVLIDRFGNQVIRHPKRVLSAGMGIVAIAIIGVFMIRVEVNINSFFKPGTEIRDSIEFMDREMTGTMDLQIRYEGDVKDPDNLKNMVRLQKYLETNPGVTTTLSIADVIQQMHRTVMDDDPQFEVIPDTRDKVNNLFTLYSMSGDPDDFSSLVDYEYSSGLITALMRSIPTSQITKFVNGIESFVDNKLDMKMDLSITGMVVILRDLVYIIVRSSAISIVVSITVIALIAGLFFRRGLWGLLAIIPLTSAVLLNFGLMGLFGVDLSHITAILSSIIIGVGVDFAIHYIAQFRNYSRKGTPLDKLSHEVVDDVGYPIILDAASNMGFGALILSAFLPIQAIGGLMVFAMVSTSLGTLTLLASVTELLKKRLINH